MLLALIFIYSCNSFIINRTRHIPRVLRANMVSKSLAVGIERTLSEYISQNGPTRVNGFVKLLLEDFHVHEIDLDGKVLNLGTFVRIPQVKLALENKRRTETGQKFLSTFERGKFEYPDHLLTEMDTKRLDEMLGSLSEIFKSDQPSSDRPFTFLVCRDSESMKEIRTQVHLWVRSELPFLETRTVDFKACQSDEKMKEHLALYLDFATLPPEYGLIHVTPTQLCVKLLSRRDKSTDAADVDLSSAPTLEELVKRVDLTDYSTYNPKSYGRFLHFNVLKINRETSEVVNMMCKLAGRASFDFFSAGNKDKRGITVQRLCIRRCNIADLFKAMARGWSSDVYLSQFCYKNSKISLGDLSGNHFKIAIRGIDDHTSVHNAIETLKNNGFINYFGLQRFGTKIVGTHVIGAAIIDQSYDLALRLILGDIEAAKQFAVFNKYFSGMDPVKLSRAFEYPTKQEGEEQESVGIKFRRATDYYLFDNDPETALKYLPGHLFVEKSVLKGILAQLGPDKCLEKVPKNILTIYVHSTQSLLFNLAATERLNRFGLKVVVGDLVVTGDIRLNDSGSSDDFDETKPKTNKRMQVLEVNTPEEAERYTIEQVVLPLPGDNIAYPSNMEDYYGKASVENFGIPLENFSTFKQVNEKRLKGVVSVGGSYRFLVVKPSDVTYRLIEKLEDPFEVLIRPDIEEYKEDLESHEAPRNLERIYKLGDQIRNKSALILTCSLPKSSYITVALREILNDESIENNHG